jgi:hypothetical protein
VQPQRVRVGVLGVALDPVVAHEDGLVLPDGALRADDRVQLARRPADQLSGVLLRCLGDLQCLFGGVVRARGLVASVRVLVETAVPGALLALDSLGVCHGLSPYLP